MNYDFKTRSIISSTGYAKYTKSYLVVKTPYSVAKEQILTDYIETTEKEYLDFHRFVKERAKARSKRLNPIDK